MEQRIVLNNQTQQGISEQLQTYLDNHDYNGAAQFMGRIRKDNPNPYIRASLEDQYNTMSRDARIYEAGLNKSSDIAARQAFAFAHTMETRGSFGNMSDNGIFKMYADNIDKSFGGSDNITVRFAPKHVKRAGLFGIDALAADIDRNSDGFTVFKEQLGMNDDQLKQAGYTIQKNSDGTVSMTINKSQKELLWNAMRALSKTNTKYDGNKDGYQDMDDDDAVPMFQMYGTDNNGNTVESPRGLFGRENSGNNASEGNGRTLDEYYETDAKDAYTSKELENIFGVEKKALDYYNDVTKNAHVKLGHVQYFNTYNPSDKAGEDNKAAWHNEGSDKAIAASLGQVNLAEYEIYSNYDGSDSDYNFSTNTATMHSIKDGTNRSNIGSILHQAIQKNNYTYSDAILGDMVGKYITIPAETDESGNLIHPEMTIFVKDLFNDSQATKDFKNDTKTLACLEANSMSMYGYDMTIPDVYGDGDSKLHYNTDRGVFEYTPSTSKDAMDITKEQAQDLLNTKFIIDKGVSKIQDAAYNANGTPRRGYNTSEAFKDLRKYIVGAVYETSPQTYQNLLSSVGDLLNSDALDQDGLINRNNINNQLALNDVDYFNILASNYRRYILNNTGLVDVLRSRDRGDYSN